MSSGFLHESYYVQGIRYMKLLIAIANYGTKNLPFLQSIIKEYQSMIKFEPHILILSDKTKYLGNDIEVLVGLPSKNPWSLPLAHKQVFIERLNKYDLFIYSEDDTLIKESNIEAFLKATKVLPKNKIAGFMRYEIYPGLGKYYTTIHGHYHWIPNSVFSKGEYIFARYSNDHSACYMVTQNQLRMAINNGLYTSKSTQSQYDLLCTAATIPYNGGCFEKVIAISHIDQFSLHHLPNVYKGKMGISSSDFEIQLAALKNTNKKEDHKKPILSVKQNSLHPIFRKRYYEDKNIYILNQIQGCTNNILSLGCGSAETEGELVRRGNNVFGVPIDPIMGSLAESKGVKIFNNLDEIFLSQNGNPTFDYIIMNNILQYLHDPIKFVKRLKSILKIGGGLIIRTQNHFNISLWKELVSQNYVKLPFFKIRLNDKDSNIRFMNLFYLLFIVRRCNFKKRKFIFESYMRSNTGSMCVNNAINYFRCSSIIVFAIK